MAQELDALELWVEGDLVAAEAAMEDALQDGLYFLDLGALGARPTTSWYLAEIRQALGDLPGAIDQFNKWESFFADLVPGWERTAQLYEELGNHEEAIRHYREVVNAWADADPALQPRREAARQRMEALLDLRAREPAG